jgi:molecular chaperone HscC
VTAAKPIIGIDLGTTNSLVAVFEDGAPRIVPNALGEGLTPSVVCVEPDGSILVGAAARARATTRPEHVARSFKRDMGTPRAYSLGGREFSAPQLSAMVLASLKRDAEAALGCEVEEAVITVPAYFGYQQREATRDAGQIAGLRVERIINEPTAAALAYGLHERGREQRVAVLDLGGGTFDVTVLEIIDGVVEVQGSAGDVKLGGDDFDAALAALVRQKFAQAGSRLASTPAGDARLDAAAERLKRTLSSERRGRLAIPDASLEGGLVRGVELELTREEAEEAWQPLLDRLHGPIVRALRDAKTKAGQIDEVLLVGGSTRLPCVVKLAASLFGRLPARTLPPDEAIALGAAVQAALKGGDRALEDMVVTDVAPFTLGISSASRDAGQQISGLFSPIIERGTVIPASRVERFATMADGQRELLVEVFQGEHSLCRDNQRLGEYKLKNIPRGPAGQETIDVRFTYDVNGLIDVDMTIVSTGHSENLLIERTPGRMSRSEVARAREQMTRLKFHPRESLPNRTALLRAEALYLELTGDDRAALGAMLARYRLALESQRPDQIDPTRQQLLALLAALGHLAR